METKLYFLILIFCVGITSCSKEKDNLQLTDNSANLLSLPNLIQNSEFEINGQSSFQYWNYTYGPCCLDTFSADVPTGGGGYSLHLEPMWVPATGSVETYITGLNSNNIFRLKFNGKMINSLSAEASASIYLKSVLGTSTIWTLNFNNTQWTQYILLTNPIQLVSSDTLVVKLSAGSTEVATWSTLFDNIELVQIPN